MEGKTYLSFISIIENIYNFVDKRLGQKVMNINFRSFNLIFNNAILNSD